jgi:hypothetical protein
MKSGTYWTFAGLRSWLRENYGIGASEAAVSARIRELRKPPYNLIVERRKSNVKGVWLYRAREESA